MDVQVILTVSNSIICDDAAGPFSCCAVTERAGARLATRGWRSAPENVVHRVRGVEPERVLVVEAAEIELELGEVRLVDDRLIVEQFTIFRG